MGCLSIRLTQIGAGFRKHLWEADKLLPIVKVFKATKYFALRDMPRQCKAWWKRVWEIIITLRFLWWLPLVKKSHTAREKCSSNRSSRIKRRGLHCAFSKFSGTPFLLNAVNWCFGTALCSLYHQIITSGKFSSVHNVSRCCKRRMQNVVFPDPVGPPIIQVNGCLSPISLTMDVLC